MDANILGLSGVIVTILVVGVALAGLILKLNNDTNGHIDAFERRLDETHRRIDELAIRISEFERSIARIEGYMAGLQTATSQAAA